MKELGQEGFWNKGIWPPSIPDCNPLDFFHSSPSGNIFFSLFLVFLSILPCQDVLFSTTLVAHACAKVPRNRLDPVSRIEGTWHNILDLGYLDRNCSAAWDCLWLVASANAKFVTSKNSNSEEEESDSDE